MAIIEEGPRAKPSSHVVGEDLSRLSEHELDERITVLRAEIGRLEAVLAAKRASRDAAAAFFKK